VRRRRPQVPGREARAACRSPHLTGWLLASPLPSPALASPVQPPAVPPGWLGACLPAAADCRRPRALASPWSRLARARCAAAGYRPWVPPMPMRDMDG